MYVCMYVCMLVGMYICYVGTLRNVCMHACLYPYSSVDLPTQSIHPPMYLHIHAYMQRYISHECCSLNTLVFRSIYACGSFMRPGVEPNVVSHASVLSACEQLGLTI